MGALIGKVRRSAPSITDEDVASVRFSVIGRLADAFGFRDPGPRAFEAGAKYLLARGYR